VGISSGANVFAACQVAETLPADQVVVTVLCDTGERYLSVTF
jgi:cysteine synthase A